MTLCPVITKQKTCLRREEASIVAYSSSRIPLPLMRFFSLLKKTSIAWKQDKVPQLAASTAYYTAFSLAPLLLIIVGVAGLFFDSETVQTRMMLEIQTILGEEATNSISSLLDSAQQSDQSLLGTIIGIVTLLAGATGLMLILQDAVNFIWKVETKKTSNSFLVLVVKRIFSLGLILTIGFLLLVSLIVSTLSTAFMGYLSASFPVLGVLLPPLNFLLSFLLIFFLFAILFKYLPDVQLAWTDVLLSAALTAFLFVIGKTLLGFYLGQKDVASAYGVAGSFIVLLLWIYYSAQILFFGIEFTRVYAEEHHRVLVPRNYAEFIETPDHPTPTLLPRRTKKHRIRSVMQKIAKHVRRS